MVRSARYMRRADGVKNVPGPQTLTAEKPPRSLRPGIAGQGANNKPMDFAPPVTTREARRSSPSAPLGGRLRAVGASPRASR